MLVSFSSLRGNCVALLWAIHLMALPLLATTCGEGFMLSGSEMVKNEMKLRVATLFTANDKVNPIPMLNKVLEMALLLDPTSCLKAPKSSLSPIMAVYEIP